MRSHFIFFHHLPLTIGHMLKIKTLVIIINTVQKQLTMSVMMMVLMLFLKTYDKKSAREPGYILPVKNNSGRPQTR